MDEKTMYFELYKKGIDLYLLKDRPELYNDDDGDIIEDVHGYARQFVKNYFDDMNLFFKRR